MRSLEKLIQIGSEPIAPWEPDLTWAERQYAPALLLHELVRLLTSKNGFFAFESALLVLPSDSIGSITGLRGWNDPIGWRRHYDRIKHPTMFFAQDLFAGQFGITRDAVVHLNPETGEVSRLAHSLDFWATRLLEDYSFQTGWSIGHEWQRQHGPLPAGYRLLPKRPFVLGGEFAANNLVAVNASEAIEKLGSLYEQIRDRPDGETATIRGWI